nr:hypothetical protein [uncultured Mediterraneibacter sp.]
MSITPLIGMEDARIVLNVSLFLQNISPKMNCTDFMNHLQTFLIF